MSDQTNLPANTGKINVVEPNGDGERKENLINIWVGIRKVILPKK